MIQKSRALCSAQRKYTSIAPSSMVKRRPEAASALTFDVTTSIWMRGRCLPEVKFSSLRYTRIVAPSTTSQLSFHSFWLLRAAAAAA